MYARQDASNSIETNGEARLQKEIANMLEKRGSDETVIFDVGANLGAWTISMLEALKQAGRTAQDKIYSFEPFPETHKLLQEALAAHVEEGSVNLSAAALSNTTGKIAMIGSAGAGTSSIVTGDPSAGVDEIRTTVKRETLEAYCENHGVEHIVLLKCDTEGNDFRVIEGALPLLRAERVEVLQFEYNHRWIEFRNYLKDVFQVMDSLPYTVCKITPNSLIAYKHWHPELERFFEGNYALVHKSLRAKLDIKDARLDHYACFF